MIDKTTDTIPFKVLVRLSGKLFFVLLFGALLITSLQELSFKGFLHRTLFLGLLFIVILTINALVFNFFNKRKKHQLERIWKRVFLVGCILSYLYFILHVSVFLWLNNKGFYKFPNNNTDIESITGLQYYTFLLGASMFIYLFIFLIQSSVFTQYETNQIKLKLLKLESSNADAVNQLLRQQIQPHFLFNALNILKSLIKKDARRAEDYLLHLSDFLRVSITKNTSGVSTIEEELKVCNDYMEMQRIRFGNALQYEIILPDDNQTKKQKLPFFSLQPLLENAIKHNVLTISNPLLIRIEKVGDTLIVSNNLQEKKTSDTSIGNGLNMLHERYRILNETPPIISKTEESFSIQLKIIPDEKK